ncbi:hypothetical protein EVAR_88528_1 [Eumeta japonica]|uniref:Uncharacterized protein n=1 Tax=Eumeta variegata TaxID=151549 RepID=A0A4C1WNY3_EUMVA|nr:hypothetical protein EVAR_88528_1 [Eumeta japonica]
MITALPLAQRLPRLRRKRPNNVEMLLRVTALWVLSSEYLGIGGYEDFQLGLKTLKGIREARRRSVGGSTKMVGLPVSRTVFFLAWFCSVSESSGGPTPPGSPHHPFIDPLLSDIVFVLKKPATHW